MRIIYLFIYNNDLHLQIYKISFYIFVTLHDFLEIFWIFWIFKIKIIELILLFLELKFSIFRPKTKKNIFWNFRYP